MFISTIASMGGLLAQLAPTNLISRNIVINPTGSSKSFWKRFYESWLNRRSGVSPLTNRKPWTVAKRQRGGKKSDWFALNIRQTIHPIALHVLYFCSIPFFFLFNQMEEFQQILGKPSICPVFLFSFFFVTSSISTSGFKVGFRVTRRGKRTVSACYRPAAAPLSRCFTMREKEEREGV